MSHHDDLEQPLEKSDNLVNLVSYSFSFRPEHIFISYSHQDSVYAHRLADELDQWGFRVWIDDQVGTGTRWRPAIEDAIDDCAAFIVIMTEHSRSSEWVENELAHARDKRKPIFPLLLEGETWFEVKTIQYRDVRGGGLPTSDFFDQLRQAPSSVEYLPTPIIPSLEDLASRATRNQLNGDLGTALQLYNEIKRRDPMYPRVDAYIAEIQKELQQDYVTNSQYVDPKLVIDHPKPRPAKSRSAGGCGLSLPAIVLILFLLIAGGILLERCSNPRSRDQQPVGTIKDRKGGSAELVYMPISKFRPEGNAKSSTKGSQQNETSGYGIHLLQDVTADDQIAVDQDTDGGACLIAVSRNFGGADNDGS